MKKFAAYLVAAVVLAGSVAVPLKDAKAFPWTEALIVAGLTTVTTVALVTVTNSGLYDRNGPFTPN